MAGEWGTRTFPSAGEAGAPHETVAADAKPKTRSGEAGTRMLIGFLKDDWLEVGTRFGKVGEGR